jgi:hypothetical protein
MLYDDLVPHGEWLCHHGIKGQKWGVRRYQYADGSLTDAGRRRYYKGKTGMSKFAGMITDDFAERTGQAVDERKELHWGNNDVHGPGYYSPVTFRNERKRQSYIDDPDTAMSKQCSRVNPTYGTQEGTTNNCPKVAAALVLARMGYDYEAGRAVTGYGESFGYWFDGAKKSLFDGMDDAVSSIESSKPGSFGTIDFRHSSNPKNGHVFNWEHKSDGSYTIYDAQPTGGQMIHKRDLGEALSEYLSMPGHAFDPDNRVLTYDLTDASPNWDHMAEDSVVRFGSQAPLSDQGDAVIGFRGRTYARL